MRCVRVQSCAREAHEGGQTYGSDDKVFSGCGGPRRYLVTSTVWLGVHATQRRCEELPMRRSDGASDR